MLAISPDEAARILKISDPRLWELVVIEKKIRRILVQRTPHYKWGLSKTDVERLAKRKAA